MMENEKGYLVDVGMNDLPFPVRAISKVDPDGQPTIANISINARIMQNFEPHWISKFIKIAHQHREVIGTKSLTSNINEYSDDLNASMIRIDFNYPFFIEKLTPVSEEKSLVRYLCTFSAKASTVNKTKIIFKMDVPVITSYPVSFKEAGDGLFGQLSIVNIEVETSENVYPEDLVEIVDRHALVPTYSFLTEKDENYVISKIHSERVSSVKMAGKIKNELTKHQEFDWFSVRCFNHGMIHSYNTVVGTEKSLWVPDINVNDESYGFSSMELL